MASLIYQKLKTAEDAIRTRTPLKPAIGIILGSGMGSLAEHCESPVVIPYNEIPNFHGTSVEGTSGRLVIGLFEGVPVACLLGRFHLYEGYHIEDVVFPTRVLASLGIHTLILTSASGGINTRYKPGDLMLIKDHLNLTGDNPLKGPHLGQLGPRFPDMSEAYNRECIHLIQTTSRTLDISLHTGVYAGVLGPTYETPAEVRMLRSMGADAVGMSVVPEAMAAHHLGVRVSAITAITNHAAGISARKLTHEDVIQSSRLSVSKVGALLRAVVPKLAFELNSPKSPSPTPPEAATPSAR